MKAIHLFPAFAIGSLFLLSAATGATISDSFTGSALGTSTSFDLDRFDSTRGTLNSVSFSYQFVPTGDVTYQFDNDSATSGVRGVVSTTVYVSDFTIADPDVAAALSSFSSSLVGDHTKNYYTSVTLGANNGDNHTGYPDSDAAGLDYAELTFLKGMALQSYSTTLGTSLSSFYVNGIDSTFTVTTGASFSALSGFLPTVLGDYSGSLDSVMLVGTVTYDYTAVPEPSTYALLLGVGTLGLVGWRRFRRK